MRVQSDMKFMPINVESVPNILTYVNFFNLFCAIQSAFD